MDDTSLGSPLLRRFSQLSGLLDRLCGLAAAYGSESLARDAQLLRGHLARPLVIVAAGDPAADTRALVDALWADPSAPIPPTRPGDTDATPSIRLLGRQAEAVWTRIGLPATRSPGPEALPEGLVLADFSGLAGVSGWPAALGSPLACESDLLLFVFSALNPYSRSVWELFDALRTAFGDGVIVLLDRAELAGSEQLATNSKRLGDMLQARGLGQPRLYRTTEAAAGTPENGPAALRRLLSALASTDGLLAAKLAAARHAGLIMLDVLSRELEDREQALHADAAGVEAVGARLAGFLDAAKRQADRLADETDQAYRRAAAAFLDALRQELTVAGMVGKTVGSVVKRDGAAGKNPPLRALGDAFAKNLGNDLEAIAAAWSGKILEDVEARLGFKRDSVNLLRLSGHWPQADALAARRGEILDALAGLLDALALDRQTALAGEFAAVAGLGPKALAGGALAVAGTVFAVTLKGAAFDVTGGLITSVGAAVAGGALLWQRGQFLEDVALQLEAGRLRLYTAVGQHASSQLNEFYENFSENLRLFQENILQRRTSLQEGVRRHASTQAALKLFQRDDQSWQ